MFGPEINFSHIFDRFIKMHMNTSCVIKKDIPNSRASKAFSFDFQGLFKAFLRQKAISRVFQDKHEFQGFFKTCMNHV